MNRAAFWIGHFGLLLALAGCGEKTGGAKLTEQGEDNAAAARTWVNPIVSGEYSFVEIIQELASALEAGVLPTANQLEAKNNVSCRQLACEISRRSE